MVVGGGVGAMFGVLVQNIAFPSATVRMAARRNRLHYKKANQAWQAVERRHSGLFLVQAGWDEKGCFPENSIIFQLDGEFELGDDQLRRLRAEHAADWLAAGLHDGEQVGICSVRISRTSDEAADERQRRSHLLRLEMHTYRYFDFLATHLLRLSGTTMEVAILDGFAGSTEAGHPVAAFPNPCSVGLSVVCEDGSYLALVRRTASPAGGGWWQARKVFNAVGENSAVRDFTVALDGSRQSAPWVVARRGLYEELGLSVQDLVGCTIAIHSFAWSKDILDHKFFGFALVPLSREELQDRWRNAPDRAEAAGTELIFHPIQNHTECRILLSSILKNTHDWAPEAVFSTIRTLITLRKVAHKDLRR